MVQTPGQYVYLHFSICTYCERKLNGNSAAVGHVARLRKFFAEYKDFANKEEAIDRDLVKRGKDPRQQTNVSNR